MEAGVVVEIASRPTFLVVRLTLEPARCHAPLVPLPGAPPIPRFPWFSLVPSTRESCVSGVVYPLVLNLVWPLTGAKQVHGT
jgi:hypothetical protein